MNILDEIVSKTRERVAVEKAEGVREPADSGRDPFLFERVLRGVDMKIICEIKKAAPTTGWKVESFPYMTIARHYEEAGASAISIFTEPNFFGGESRYLAEIREVTDLALLRRDFIIDPFQIMQSATFGADGIMLTCSIVTPEQLGEYIRLADVYGISSLVDVRDEGELEIAVSAGARILFADAYSHQTGELQMERVVRLKEFCPPGCIFVAGGGISTPEHVAVLRKAGINALIIGQAIMGIPNKKARLGQLCGRAGMF